MTQLSNVTTTLTPEQQQISCSMTQTTQLNQADGGAQPRISTTHATERDSNYYGRAELVPKGEGPGQP